MTRLEFIKEQSLWVDVWTMGLIEPIDEKQWGVVPQLGTGVNWLVGHLIVSKYYHSIESILHPESKLISELHSTFPLEEYKTNYYAKTNPSAPWKNRPNKEQLIQTLKFMGEVSFNIIERLDEEDLDRDTHNSNPVAKNRYEALTFSFKHQMWHNGQIAMVRRILATLS